MNKPLPNARVAERTFSIEYLDRSFLFALNQIGQHEFSGPLAYAIYRNSKTVDKVLKEFSREMNTLIRSHTENDGKGGIAMETDAKGAQTPKFRSEEDRKSYVSMYTKLYKESPISIKLQTVSEQEFEQAITSIEGGVAANVLSTLRPMISEEEDEDQDTSSSPLSVVPKENIPSGPVVIESTATNGNDPQHSANQPDGLQQPSQEPQAGPVLEREPQDGEHDGDSVLHGADNGTGQSELPQ